MTRAYHPPRPSLWRDLRAIPFDLRGAPMLLVPVMLWLAAMIGEVLR